MSIEHSPGRYVSDRFLADRYGVTRQTIWDWTKTKADFPQPIKFSDRCTRWRLGDAEAWEATQAEQSAA